MGAQRQPVIEGEVNSMMDIIADASDAAEAATIDTGMPGVNWVLGGGIPIEAAILLAAFPGAGKTTFIVELFRKLALGGEGRESTVREGIDTLLIQTEETAKQIGRRYARLGKFPPKFGLVHECSFSNILELLEKHRPRVAAIDSLTKLEGVTDSNGMVFSSDSPKAVSLAALQLKKFAGENEMSIFCTGHSTKEGAVAGSNTLIHDLDMTLYIDGKTESARGRPVLDGLHDEGPLTDAAYQDLKTAWSGANE